MKESNEITLILTAAEVSHIGRVLGERPYTEVVALLAKMQQQINAVQALPKPASPATGES